MVVIFVSCLLLGVTLGDPVPEEPTLRLQALKATQYNHDNRQPRQFNSELNTLSGMQQFPPGPFFNPSIPVARLESSIAQNAIRFPPNFIPGQVSMFGFVGPQSVPSNVRDGVITQDMHQLLSSTNVCQTQPCIMAPNSQGRPDLTQIQNSQQIGPGILYPQEANRDHPVFPLSQNPGQGSQSFPSSQDTNHGLPIFPSSPNANQGNPGLQSFQITNTGLSVFPSSQNQHQGSSGFPSSQNSNLGSLSNPSFQDQNQGLSSFPSFQNSNGENSGSFQNTDERSPDLSPSSNKKQNRPALVPSQGHQVLVPSLGSPVQVPNNGLPATNQNIATVSHTQELDRSRPSNNNPREPDIPYSQHSISLFDQRKFASFVQALGMKLTTAVFQGGAEDNVVFSPVSIASLLGLLLLATKNSSSQELRAALNVPDHVSDIKVHQQFQNILHFVVEANDKIILNLASRLFLQKGVDISPLYLERADNYYNSQATEVDFQRNPNGVMNEVNQWVSHETSGKIPKLLTSSFKPCTNFVAANTIYFNGNWETPFSKIGTYNKTFNTGTKNLTIPFMNNIITVPYMENNALEMIALKYSGGKFALFIIKPKAQPGLKSVVDIENALTPDNLINMIGEMKPNTMSVGLPRIGLRYKTFLKDALQLLQVKSIFSQQSADFSSLTRDKVWVDNIVHEAVLEMTEEGTIAAGATSSSLNRFGTSNAFKVDQPSLLFIRDVQYGLPLFMARLITPNVI